MTRRFVTAVIFILAALAQPAHAQLAPGTLSLPSSTTIPFVLSGNHIFVRATLDGKPFAFIFDTGGTAALSPAAEQALGLRRVARARLNGAGSATSTVDIVNVPELDIGDVSYKHGQFVVLPELPFVSPFDGVPYGGLFGREIFRQLVVTIDYERSQLTFTRPSAFSPPPGSSEIPLTMFNGVVPNIPATINGHTGNFDIDAGDEGALMVTQAFARDSGLDKEFSKTITAQIGVGVGGPIVATVGRSHVFQIGGYSLPNMIVSVAEPAGFFASRGLSGNIGTEILRRFIVTLDVPANKLIIRPDADFSAPMVFDRAGVTILPQDDGWRAAFLIPGGPAEQAGIAAGDLVISVNGKPPAALGPDGLRDIEQGPVGSVVQVVFEHNGTRYTKSLVLRDIL